MIKEFLTEVKDAIDRIDERDLEKVIDTISKARRLFIIGSGGGAGNASHAVCDFRKLCNIDAYTFENISELTARTNDEGWNSTITAWLTVSEFSSKDCLFVLSVGGGTPAVSINLHSAIIYADNIGASIVGIVGRDGGTLAQYTDARVIIKTKNFTTPVVEGLQSVLTHLIVTNLAKNKTVW